MKAIIEFELPQDQEEFDITQKAHAYKYAIDQFAAALRKYRKYDESLTEEQIAFLEKITGEFYACTDGLEI